jgi:DedD protein
MIYNERGGIISKIMFLPIALAMMAGFFFLGYFVGKYPSKSEAIVENLPPMPEVVTKNIPKPEDFTFYKTLTDNGGKTVSIDIKPEPAVKEKHAEKNDDAKPAPGQNAQAADREKPVEKKIGAVTHQRVETKKKAPAPPRAEKIASSRYTLQIAAYQDRNDAEADVKKMKQRGYAAFVVSSELPGKGTWYRVRLGSFSNKASAEKLQRDLRAKEGISPFITPE